MVGLAYLRKSLYHNEHRRISKNTARGQQARSRVTQEGLARPTVQASQSRAQDYHLRRPIKLVWQPPDCLGVVPAVKNVDRSLYEACSVWTAKCHWIFRRGWLSQSSLAEAFWHIKIAHKQWSGLFCWVNRGTLCGCRDKSGEFLANTVCGPGRVLRQQERQLHLQIHLLIVLWCGS